MNASEESPIWMEAGREAELVVASQAGDLSAFLELTRFYHRHVYRLAYAMTRSPEKAATLTQETFVRAWQGLKGFSDRRRFFPWVLRIARNNSAARSRLPVGAEAADASDSKGTLLAAFSELRPDEQMALALRATDRLPYREITALLELSAGAAIVRISNARGLLFARAFGPDGDDR
jgi:RNA polymerase sigma-70 factor (ECF subfamily)